MEAHAQPQLKPFSASLDKFFALTEELQKPETKAMQLSSLESLLESQGRDLLRCLIEDHIELRGVGDNGVSILGSDDVERTHRRERSIVVKSIFGEITVKRLVYSKPEHVSLVPKDAALNLPETSYSHGLQQKLACELAKNSYGEAIAAVSRQTGLKTPRQQAEAIAKTAARDFQDFYKNRETEALRKTTRANDFLILTTDGKGVVMRKADLREVTRKRAEETEHKLETRLSRGEKKHAKRMAQVASVYSIEAHKRSAEDIVSKKTSSTSPPPPPRPEAKRVWASVSRDAKDVVRDMFDEAKRRDPYRKRDMAVLVDGQNYQLGLIQEELASRGLNATIIVDIVHVIEYLWKASRVFFAEASREGEAWVKHYLLMILEGKAKQAAAGMRRSATRQGKKSRKAVETCATYIHDRAEFMAYDLYLAKGMPISTGVIEGACRHLVKDRMEVTGARWSLEGAEAILKLRSIYTSGDWEEYWNYHEEREYQRNHAVGYAQPEKLAKSVLRLVK